MLDKLLSKGRTGFIKIICIQFFLDLRFKKIYKEWESILI